MAAVLAQPLHRDERLLIAVACSLVLHLGFLYLLPVLFDPDRKANPEPEKLIARLAEPKPPETPKLAEPAPPAPAPAPKAARLAPRKPAAPTPRVRDVAPPAITVPTSPSVPTVAAASAPVATAPVHPAPAPAITAPAPAPAAGPDPGSIAQFRLELIEVAKRHKRYPRAAVDNNWEGKVDLRMVIAANGSIASLSVRKSAGFVALDNEAQQMFRTAKAELAIPPALRGKEFTVDVSADFYFVKE